MEKDRYTNVYDIRLQEVYYISKDESDSDEAPGSFAAGEIKFRKDKSKGRIKFLFKSLAFILIASISGAASATYIVNKRFERIDTSNYSDSYKIPNVMYGENNVLPKNSITKVVELVGPAVVGISNSSEGFSDQIVTRYSGSGIIFDKDGYIVTNYHIIKETSEVLVKLASGNAKPLSAKVVGYDISSDIAVLKVEQGNLPVARLGDSMTVRAGDVAIAIGNPFGLEGVGSVTSGIISSINKRIHGADSVDREKDVYKVLQTDAEINWANTGGPLCNEYGEIIGINNNQIISNQTSGGTGYAISISEVKKIVTSLINEGEVVRPSFGIDGGTYPENSLGVQGVYVGIVYVNTGAWEAGIRTSDVIIELDDMKIKNYEDYLSVIEKHKIGDILTCKLLRNGVIVETKVTLKKNK